MLKTLGEELKIIDRFISSKNLKAIWATEFLVPMYLRMGILRESTWFAFAMFTVQIMSNYVLLQVLDDLNVELILDDLNVELNCLR